MATFYTYVDPDELDKIYLQDKSVGKYGSDEDEKRKPTDEMKLNQTGKSTRLWPNDKHEAWGIKRDMQLHNQSVFSQEHMNY